MFQQARRKTPTILVVILITALLSTVGIIGCTGLTTEITITQEEIDSALADSFPISESYDDLLTITMENPRVDLTEGSDRMVIGVDASVVLNVPELEIGTTLSGSADLETGISYNPDTGEIILEEPSLVSLSIEGIPDVYLDLAVDVAGGLLTVALDGQAVYTLEPEDFQTAVASITLEGLRIENGLLVVTLGL